MCRYEWKAARWTQVQLHIDLFVRACVYEACPPARPPARTHARTKCVCSYEPEISCFIDGAAWSNGSASASASVCGHAYASTCACIHAYTHACMRACVCVRVRHTHTYTPRPRCICGVASAARCGAKFSGRTASRRDMLYSRKYGYPKNIILIGGDRMRPEKLPPGLSAGATPANCAGGV